MEKVPLRSMDTSPFDVTIREPTPADAAAVARMHLAAWREAYTPLLPSTFWDGDVEQRWADRWTANLAEPVEGAVGRIAVRDGEVLGLASAGPSRPNPTAGEPVHDLELWALYVRASEYGTGLATRLLDAVLPDDEAAELWVFDSNPRAKAFYAKQGFVADGARHVFGPDLGGRAEIRMVR